jgi:hypothetical protein
MSFFQWLREGVRQAVVLGLADAVEDVGTRSQGEDLGPALAQSLRERLTVQRDTHTETMTLESKGALKSGALASGALASGTLEAGAASTATPARRRLGRSLDHARDGLRKAA